MPGGSKSDSCRSTDDSGIPLPLLELPPDRRLQKRLERRARLVAQRGLCSRLKASGKMKWYFDMIERWDGAPSNPARTSSRLQS